MKVVSWPTGVNRIVTSETSGTLAENGVENDKSENGSEMSRLRGSGVPDRYQVSMTFSNDAGDPFYRDHTDAYGRHITEWEAWCNWFKFILLNGTYAFYFHDICSPGEGKTAVYKISAAGLPNWNPNGGYVQVHMTWIRVFTDYLTVREEEPEADSLDVEPGIIELHLTEQPSEPPLKEDFYDANGESLVLYSVDSGETFSPLPVMRVDWDGYKTVVLQYDSALTAETLDGDYYVITVPYGESTVRTEFLGGQ